MKLNLVGYFNRLDKHNNIRLVNLEPEYKQVLGNCHTNLFPKYPDAKSPILANAVIIKHDNRALVYDVKGIPTSTPELMGAQVKVSVKARKYKFRPSKSDSEPIVGWNLKLISMTAAFNSEK